MSGALATRFPTAEPIASTKPLRQRIAFSVYEKALVLLFLITLPLVNPWVRGDGVSYYAYVRAVLIDHNLRFEKDWLAANPTFRMARVESDGKVKANQYTATGHLKNHFSVGPAILWAPLLAVTHLAVLGLIKLGARVPPDGYSRPYLVTMALATATYGFAGLYLAFCLGRRYFEERWAFLGTLGVWFASSLPVYMYFNPSWSHAHSAFAVSLFLWYWHRTRGNRTYGQWMLLGVLSGLMLNIYYPNGIFLLVPLLESLRGYWQVWRKTSLAWPAIERLLLANLLYAAAMGVAFLPTLITRRIIYGHTLEFGYENLPSWSWTAPHLGKVLFSSEHGLLSWTPILILALIGLVCLRIREAELGNYFIVCFLAYYYLIASYPNWAGISSFGNRFFVSLTPVFILGLTALLSALGEVGQRTRVTWTVATTVTALFVVWNLGFIFQWGMHLVPARGQISWKQMAYNQVMVVPGKMFGTLRSYLVARGALMGHIEAEDVQQIKNQRLEDR
jgi:hypothetical protein